MFFSAQYICKGVFLLRSVENQLNKMHAELLFNNSHASRIFSIFFFGRFIEIFLLRVSFVLVS